MPMVRSRSAMTRTIRRSERFAEYDRTGWGPGPWDDEPDLIEWRNDEFPEMAFLIVRSEVAGALCGYVGLPPGHRLHGKATGDLDVEVHGGLTFADECHGRICHVPAPGEPAHVWWLGFDCGHCFDAMPALEALTRRTLGRALPHGTYRTLDYVMAEVERLAAQVKP